MKFMLLLRNLTLLLIGAVLCTSPLLARAEVVIILVVTPAFEGNYVPGTWLPLTLRITNNGPPVAVHLSATLPADTATYVQEQNLAGGVEQQAVLYVPMDQVVHELDVVVSDRSGAILARQTVEVRPRTDERMLGIVGSSDPGLRLPRRQDLASQPFTAIRMAPADLPDRLAGLGSLGIILINDLSAESLTPDQQNALLAWVSAGGHLVLGGGSAAEGVLAALPPELQAAMPGASLRIDDTPLADLAGASGPGQIDAIRLVPLAVAQPQGLPTGPAWVTRQVGVGVVTQLAFAPDLPALRNWAAAPAFWDKLLTPAIVVHTPLGQQTNLDSTQEQILAGALTLLPTVNQPPVDPFFIALIIYTLLIGPVLALFLRRIDRQAWSWLLLPTIAGGSAALLFTLAINLRADERIVTQVSLVESIGAGQARVRTLVGMLVPRAQTLTVSVPVGAITRPLRSASGLYTSIEGVRGPILAQSAHMQVALDPWHLRGLTVEQIIPLDTVEAKIIVDDQGAQVNVVNHSQQRLVDVVAVYGEQVVRLGDMQPDDESTARWPPTMNLAPPGTSVSAIILSDAIAATRLPGQAAERRTQVRQSLIDAAIVSSMTRVDATPMVLALMEHSPLAVGVDATHAAWQQMTLLVLHPVIEAHGTLNLPNDWLRISQQLSASSTCSSSIGTGIQASPTPVGITLRLPTDLAPLRADTLKINLTSSGRWPSSGVVTEIYDWQQQIWVEQDFDGPGDLVLANPAPYLSQGQIQLRLGGTIDQAKCIYISTKLQGTMP